MNTVHGSLHIFVEVLNTETDPIESERCQQLQHVPIRAPRIDLDGVIAAFRTGQLELSIEPVDDLDQQLLRQKSGRTAAEVQLIDDPVPVEQSAAQGNLPKQMFDVRLDAIQPVRDDLVTAAVEAWARAKRHVKIGGQWLRLARALARGRCPLVVTGQNPGCKVLGRRIRGVPRAFPIIATHAVSIEGNGSLVGHVTIPIERVNTCACNVQSNRRARP